MLVPSSCWVQTSNPENCNLSPKDTIKAPADSLGAGHLTSAACTFCQPNFCICFMASGHLQPDCCCPLTTGSRSEIYFGCASCRASSGRSCNIFHYYVYVLCVYIPVCPWWCCRDSRDSTWWCSSPAGAVLGLDIPQAAGSSFSRVTRVSQCSSWPRS